MARSCGLQVILTVTGAGSVPSRTIPQVLADAAARDPGGVWVRSDEGTLSFAGALGQAGQLGRPGPAD